MDFTHRRFAETAARARDVFFTRRQRGEGEDFRRHGVRKGGDDGEDIERRASRRVRAGRAREGERALDRRRRRGGAVVRVRNSMFDA